MTPTFRKFLVGGLVAAIVPVAQAAASPQVTASAPAARVDGVTITRAQVLRANPAAAANPAAFEAVLQEYVNTVLLAEEAQRRKLDDEPTVRESLAEQRLRVLAGADQLDWLSKHANVDEASVAARYAVLQRAPAKTEYRLREIVVHDRAHATQILDRLAQGANFSVLAASAPLTPNAAFGGELGWLDEAHLQPSIHEAVASLSEGQVTGPIVVPDGLAIVQLLGKRESSLPPLAEMRARIVEQLRLEALRSHLESLRAAATIHVYPGPEQSGHTGAKP